MLRVTLAAAMAMSLIATPLALAQTPPPAAAPATAPADAAKAAKPLSPKQQKAKDCRAKWKEEKKASTEKKTRDDYRNFMKTCTTAA
jgi:hypothetical protein